MKKINIGVPIVTLILGILIGLLSWFLFDLSSSDLLVSNTPDTSAAIKKEMAEKENLYQAKMTELESKNHELQQELTTVKTQLSSIKLKTKQRETTIKKIIEPKGMPAQQLLEKVRHTDSAGSNLSTCESLANEVREYIEENAIKDSLYEAQTIKLDSTIAIRDSMIQTEKQMHIQLSNTVSSLLNEQQNLLKENKALRKQFKRQKFKSKLVAAGLMILSGAATNFILNH